MSTEMHPTLERYFAATNQHDVAGMTADLADDAVVKDDAHEYRGVAAIRAWTEDTIRKYKLTAKPTKVVSERDGIAVSVIGSGDFPGSPLLFTYRFKLAGEKIAQLEIS